MKQYQDTSREVFFMSLPIFGELLLQLLVGNVDQFMMSRVSQDAVAAIGNGNQLMNLVIIVLNVMSIATTILISQYLGARDQTKIAQVCNLSLLVMGIASLGATLVLLLGHRTIFSWLRVPQTVMDPACTYLTIVSSFILVQGLYLTFSSILRAFGRLREVMLSSVVMNAVNILLNAVLINGLLGFPALGIAGAAISTNISKCVGLGLVFLFFRTRVGAPLSPGVLRPFPGRVLRRLLLLSLPSGGENLSYNLSQTCILRFVNLFGTAVIATRVYCNMLANAAYIYSQAISQAAQIIVGYLVGSRDLERISHRVWATIAASLGVSLSLTGLMLLFSNQIFGLFTQDAAIWALGRQILVVELVLEIGRSVNITMVRCLVAVGDVAFPVYVGVFSMWIVATLGSYFLGVVLDWGLVGIWVAMAMDECLRGLIFVFRFRSGRWRAKALPEPAPAG